MTPNGRKLGITRPVGTGGHRGRADDGARRNNPGQGCPDWAWDVPRHGAVNQLPHGSPRSDFGPTGGRKRDLSPGEDWETACIELREPEEQVAEVQPLELHGGGTRVAILARTPRFAFSTPTVKKAKGHWKPLPPSPAQRPPATGHPDTGRRR